MTHPRGTHVEAGTGLPLRPRTRTSTTESVRVTRTPGTDVLQVLRRPSGGPRIPRQNRRPQTPHTNRLPVTTPGAGFRTDVQGLRAVAVLMVLLYHTGLGPSGGFLGVDVFFVLSGFLITGLLVREHQKTGRISLTAFWAKRARRLLPASVLVLLVTCLTARWWLPASRWESVGQDAIASAAYAINWRLAAGSVDYLSEGAAPSPLQHFWSLAIEEQFYLAWPLLISLVLLARTKKVAIGVISAVIAGSLLLALLTYSPQTYFTTHTRVWELAAGALCAITMPRARRRAHARAATQGQRWSRALLGWSGLALILGALFVVRPETMWPGPLTVVVVVGTMLILRYGLAAQGAHLLLSNPALTRIGDISYSLYLWHWPLVVFAQVDGDLTVVEGLAVVAISLALAAATYALVENPARTARFWAPTGLGLAGGLTLALVAAGSGTLLAQARSVQEAVHAVGAAGTIEVQPAAKALTPRPEEAKNDSGEIYTRGCPSNYADATVRPCVFDFRAGPDSPTVVAVGDSKMGQWIPALEEIARQERWQLISMTKAGCAFSDTRRFESGALYTSCIDWNQAVRDQVTAMDPDLLFTTQLETYPVFKNGKVVRGEVKRREMIRGLRVRLAEMKRAGIPVVTFAETPRMAMDVPECVSLNLNTLANCAKDREEALAGEGVVRTAAQRAGDPVLDLNDRLCTDEQCPSVIGDALIYRDDHHLTGTYSRTLAPFVRTRLAEVLKPRLLQRLLPPES
ncbi:acyltransferase [Kineosporia sp. NBRC 101677]|nr:acyltransferase [Kineosporia sp. NBRC 101677]